MVGENHWILIRSKRCYAIDIETLRSIHSTTPPHPAIPLGSPDLLHYPKPSNQVPLHVWLLENHSRVIHCLESLTLENLVPAEAPVVPGLTIHAVTDIRTGTKFYGAWTTAWGNLVGWMRLRVQLTGIDMVHVAGEVLGLAILPPGAGDVSADLAAHRFAEALKEAAWDLGIAD